MPVTARLSKLFYERLGEEIANELVDWLNLVDSAYRADLRDLNEMNFQRFDAKLEQRLAQVEARLEGKIGDVRVELLRWMFMFWAGTVVPLAALILALHRL